MARQAQAGDTVRVHYTGRLADGTVFDSSAGREPLEFTLGAGAVIPGFDDGVTGMAVGDARTVEIPADQAYGAHREDLVLTLGRDRFPPGLDPAPGQQLQMQREGFAPLVVTVVEAGETEVTLDANHPLAGKALTFDLELVGID